MNCIRIRIRNRNNTSGCTGVCWDKRAKKWRAYLWFGGRQKHLGHFDILEEAIARRKVVQDLYAFHPDHGFPGRSKP